MIIVDTELSGLDSYKCGILEIGAVELENPLNRFHRVIKLDDDETIWNSPEATSKVEDFLKMSEQEMRSKERAPQEQAIRDLFEWISKIKNKVCVYQNFMDYMFLLTKARKYNLKEPFYRNIDLQSVAQTVYARKNGSILIKDDGNSSMGLKNMATFVGLEDNREVHNALEDALFEAEILSRLLYGKNLLEEYKDFPVPEYLQK